MSSLGPVKGYLLLSADLLRRRLLVENIQHPVARREGALQCASQSRQRDHRPEGGKQRQYRNQKPGKIHFSRQIKACRQNQHRQIKEIDDRIGAGSVAPGVFLHPLLRLCQLVGSAVHLRQPILPGPVLQDLIQSPQAVQHKGSQFAGVTAKPHTAVAGKL